MEIRLLLIALDRNQAGKVVVVCSEAVQGWLLLVYDVWGMMFAEFSNLRLIPSKY